MDDKAHRTSAARRRDPGPPDRMVVVMRLNRSAGFLILAAGLLLSGCRAGNPTPVLVLRSPEPASGLTHENPLYRIRFELTPRRSDPAGKQHPKEYIGIELFNKGRKGLRLLWDECVYIDATGVAHPVIHIAGGPSSKEQPQLPNLVPGGAKFFDLIAPKDHIDWSRERWTARPLFDGWEAIGKQVRLTLAVEVDGERFVQTFVFDVWDGFDMANASRSQAARPSDRLP